MSTSYTPGLGTRWSEGPAVSEGRIRELVVEFYRRVASDDWLGPIFARRILDWDRHLDRMADFWSTAMNGTGRYQGRPVEVHRGIEGMAAGHFDRWLELFEATVREVCTPEEAEAFLGRARRMREGMVKVLGLTAG
ncbi:group III truncated hemoglobin [Paludisphaera rhizosphaerae]|uniref:group III truncated hemoglobin n=1 Tax=Paludisphaera rhizosphaerae TaxID=2711216 RepID=UPI0013EBAA5B|nr:group III truncated hemoglobin [Paludisphaera rhizosphaerae]